MLLLSHDRFDLMADFEPTNGDLREFERSDAGDLLNQPVMGHYAFLDEALAALYRAACGLRLAACGFALAILTSGFDRATRFEWLRDGATSTLSIEVDGKRLSLRNPSSPSLVGDPTPFVEPEHFDFGLFVANVVSDPARLERMYRAP